MAKVFPAGWRELTASGPAARELQTLAILSKGLPDTYCVFHGVHWTRITAGNFAVVGEIDFAIVGPTGKVLLIEQKTGLLKETAGGLVKQYEDKDKDVPLQLARTVDGLHNRLRSYCRGETTYVDALLYCPDFAVRQPGTAGIDPSRIVDAHRRDQLLATIRDILPEGKEVLAARPRILRFFGELLELVPDVNAMISEAGDLYTRLAGGLAHWARCIHAEPFRLRVTATAGSGKTQLALAVYADAVSAGRRPLYVCFNRPLADAIARMVPAGGEVATYHQLADRISRDQGAPVDFTQPGAFAALEARLDTHTPRDDARFDVLIVDEGQDFRGNWADNLLRWLKPHGRAWWLEDSMQNLYGRPALDWRGWITLRSQTNYRSPREILKTLNLLLRLPQPIIAGSPLDSEAVDIVTYSDTGDLIAKTVSAINKSIGLGFKRPNIALVTYRGREHSRLAPFDRLGPYTLCAPTGQYDLFGNAEYSSGDILIDSVHRFKGRSAPCVIFTEIDFEQLDEMAKRRLFVGATRASMRLTLIVSEVSAKALLERLNEPSAE